MKENNKYNNNFYPKKSFSINEKFNKKRISRISNFNLNKNFILTGSNKFNIGNNYNSFTKKKKSILKLPQMISPINNNSKTRSSYSQYSTHNKNKSPKKIKNIKFSELFPTSLNETLYKKDKNNINPNNLKETMTESNFEQSKNNSNSTHYSKFKEYQKLMETNSFLINQKGLNISSDIKNNPFMRKIEDLNKINHFEIVFHNSIMQNIKSVYAKTKKGFFKIEHTTKSKDALGTGYVCENQNNIFSVSDMIERMNPVSTLKFSKLLTKDYKEFLGFDEKEKKKKRKDDRLRKRAINKYHKELFYQNDFADKFNIKKNPGIKFIIEKEEDNYNNNKVDEDKTNVDKDIDILY